MDKAYRTIEEEANDAFVEKKSRFIGYAKPVKTADEAAAFIASVKQQHWDAAHNVSAYVLRSGNIQRSSDDGEPSGTAGVPALEVLLKEQLVDVCVVVTRYFGGTLLGAGGLVRAYSHAAKLAVEAAGIVTMAPCCVMKLEVDYSYFDRITLLLTDYYANVENSEFGEKIMLTFSVAADKEPAFSEALTELSGGKYTPVLLGEKFAPV